MKFFKWLFNKESINLPKNKIRGKRKQEKKQLSPYRTEAPKPPESFNEDEKTNTLREAIYRPQLHEKKSRHRFFSSQMPYPQETSQTFLPYVHKLKAGEQKELKIYSGLASAFSPDHLQIKVYKEGGKDKSYVFIKNIEVASALQTAESQGEFFSSEFYENKQDAKFNPFNNFQTLTLKAKNPHDFNVEVHFGLWGQVISDVHQFDEIKYDISDETLKDYGF